MEDPEGFDVPLGVAIAVGLVSGLIATGLFRVMPLLLDFPLGMAIIAGCVLDNNWGWAFRICFVTAVVSRILLFG